MPKKEKQDFGKYSVILHREFPLGDSEEEKKTAKKLCMIDSLVGALVITLIIMVIDQAGQDISSWWWYLFLIVILYLVECMVNWRRYRSHLQQQQNHKE